MTITQKGVEQEQNKNLIELFIIVRLCFFKKTREALFLYSNVIGF